MAEEVLVPYRLPNGKMKPSYAEGKTLLFGKDFTSTWLIRWKTEKLSKMLRRFIRYSEVDRSVRDFQRAIGVVSTAWRKKLLERKMKHLKPHASTVQVMYLPA